MRVLRHFLTTTVVTAFIAAPALAAEISAKKYGDNLKEELGLCTPTRTEEYIQYQEETLPRQFPGVEVFTITEDWGRVPLRGVKPEARIP